ncbi:hypothetical protein BDZ97DRAFT_899771 [Flammula alnicola]|nr:hypothetical protein BDZ97DRAFT_899771 [Flammula alnicola]
MQTTGPMRITEVFSDSSKCCALAVWNLRLYRLLLVMSPSRQAIKFPCSTSTTMNIFVHVHTSLPDAWYDWSMYISIHLSRLTFDCVQVLRRIKKSINFEEDGIPSEYKWSDSSSIHIGNYSIPYLSEFLLQYRVGILRDTTINGKHIITIAGPNPVSRATPRPPRVSATYKYLVSLNL